MRDFPEHLRHYFHDPGRVGEPVGGADLQGEARNAACGDHLVLYLKLAEGAIAAAGFRAQGCPAAMATAAAACEALEGLPADGPLADLLERRYVAAFGAPRLAHRHALALVREALIATRPLPPASA